MSITTYGNPSTISKVCEWTGKSFVVDWKHRKQRFIDRKAMYDWRKSQNREISKCSTCGNPFERYKRKLHPRYGKLKQYCSSSCAAKSKYHRKKASEWTTKNNPMNFEKSRNKISETKLKNHDHSSYNNPEKMASTCMKKYGVACYLEHPNCRESNGTRISKFQQKTYDDIIINHPDAQPEKYIEDAQCSVDIFIPSLKKVIECYGDYWHCNPTKCSPTYYNASVHRTAQEIWDKDKKKIDKLKSLGYSTEIVWEDSNKKFIHKERPIYL